MRIELDGLDIWTLFTFPPGLDFGLAMAARLLLWFETALGGAIARGKATHAQINNAQTLRLFIIH